MILRTAAAGLAARTVTFTGKTGGIFTARSAERAAIELPVLAGRTVHFVATFTTRGLAAILATLALRTEIPVAKAVP